MWQRTGSPKLNELPPLEKNLNDFKALLQRQTPEFPVKENPNSKIVLKIESLNKPFDVKEIKCAPRKIKLNKAPVVDSLTSEMLKCSNYNLLNELKKISKRFWILSGELESWNDMHYSPVRNLRHILLAGLQPLWKEGKQTAFILWFSLSCTYNSENAT